jgi:hypothetical protein
VVHKFNFQNLIQVESDPFFLDFIRAPVAPDKFDYWPPWVEPIVSTGFTVALPDIGLVNYGQALSEFNESWPPEPVGSITQGNAARDGITFLNYPFALSEEFDYTILRPSRIARDESALAYATFDSPYKPLTHAGAVEYEYFLRRHGSCLQELTLLWNDSELSQHVLWKRRFPSPGSRSRQKLGKVAAPIHSRRRTFHRPLAHCARTGRSAPRGDEDASSDPALYFQCHPWIKHEDVTAK